MTHQNEALEMLVASALESLYLVHPTGSGKTYTACEAAARFIRAAIQRGDITRRIFFIVPKSIVTHFKMELRKKCGMSNAQIDRYCFFFTHNAFYRKFSKALATGDDLLLNMLRDNMMVVDEAHFFRTPSSKMCKTMVACAQRMRVRLLLSATPSYNRPSDVCVSLAIMYKTHYVIPTNLFDQAVQRATDPNGSNDTIKQILHGLMHKLFHVYERPPSNDYPTVEHRFQVLFMNEACLATYNAIEQAEMDKLAGSPFGSKNLAVFYNGLRRSVNLYQGDEFDSPKVTWTANYLMSDENRHKQSVVFSQFLDNGTRPLVQLFKRRNETSEILYGGLSTKKRDDLVTKFNEKQLRILCISNAGAQSLDLKCTEEMIGMESSWNEAINQQRRGRGCRLHSHAKLPVERRKVRITDLILEKPGCTTDFERYKDPNYDFAADAETNKRGLISIDHYLCRLSYQKAQLISRFSKLLAA